MIILENVEVSIEGVWGYERGNNLFPYNIFSIFLQYYISLEGKMDPRD